MFSIVQGIQYILILSIICAIIVVVAQNYDKYSSNILMLGKNRKEEFITEKLIEYSILKEKDKKN